MQYRAITYLRFLILEIILLYYSEYAEPQVYLVESNGH